MIIIQIVPRLGAVANGVADYARTVADELHASHEINTVFLSDDPGDVGRASESRWPVQTVSHREATALEDHLRAIDGSSGTLILHYVNYGYARRGCPFWLVTGLERWRALRPGNRLLVVFHELYASGPPWRSSFWLSPVQRGLARRLGDIADAAITSLPSYGRQLKRWGLSDGRLWIRGVVSTMGEVDRPASLSTRLRQLVVFGSAGVRMRFYLNGTSALRAWLARLGIEKLVDIGPAISADVMPRGLKVRAMGVLPAAEVSAVLSESYAGAIAYPPGYLGKSTIFAAYCAHGLLPLVFASGRRGEEEVRADDQYLLIDLQPRVLTETTAQAIAAKAHAWYMRHNVAQTGRWLAGRIRT